MDYWGEKVEGVHVPDCSLSQQEAKVTFFSFESPPSRERESLRGK